RSPIPLLQKLPGSRCFACETDRCKGNRYLGNNSVSRPKSPIEERLVYRQFIGKRDDSQEAPIKLIHPAPKTITIAPLKLCTNGGERRIRMHMSLVRYGRLRMT